MVKWLSNKSLLDFPQSTTAANFDYTLGHVKLDPERIINEKPAVTIENLMLEHSQMSLDRLLNA
jgi:hypothetical protein